MSELRIVEVNVRMRPLATNPSLTLYEATNQGGYDNQEYGVLIVFDSYFTRDAWMKGKP